MMTMRMAVMLMLTIIECRGVRMAISLRTEWRRSCGKRARSPAAASVAARTASFASAAAMILSEDLARCRT